MPVRRTSVSSLFILRKLLESQDQIFSRQSESGPGFGGQVKLGVICLAAELDIIFT